MEIYNLKGNISTFNNELPLDLTWNKVLIHTNSKYYEVFLSKILINDKEKTLIRPIPNTNKFCEFCLSKNNIEQSGYHQFEYENIFDFTEHCKNFDEFRVIDISNAL